MHSHEDEPNCKQHRHVGHPACHCVASMLERGENAYQACWCAGTASSHIIHQLVLDLSFHENWIATQL